MKYTDTIRWLCAFYLASACRTLCGRRKGNSGERVKRKSYKIQTIGRQKEKREKKEENRNGIKSKNRKNKYDDDGIRIHALSN
jgi:hypothetical protein